MPNSQNLSSTICPPDVFGNVWVENKDEHLAISILLEFVFGTVSSLFTYKIYQGVEISHPVYAVVFSNNLLANILSLLVFLLVIIRHCTECCSCRYLGMAIWSCIFFMNCICWTIVAILRYHLLVTTKRRGAEETDMMKMTRIALGLYWGLVILLSVTRATLIGISYGVGKVLIWIGTLVIIFLLTIITMAVYYRLDVELEANAKVANTKHETEIGEAAQSRVISNEGQRNTSKGSCKMENRSPNDRKKQSNREKNIPTCTSRLHETKVTAEEFETSNPSSYTTGTTAGLHRSDEKPYGGIYVGEEEICKKLNAVDIMKDQEDKRSSAKIEYREPPRQNERKKSHSDFFSFYDISLPNEVNETTISIMNSKSVQGACPKPPIISNEGQRNTSTGSCKMEIRSLNDRKKQSNREKNIPTCTSRHHETKVTAEEFEMSNPSSYTTGATAGLHRSDEKPYGGIYVGDEEICKSDEKLYGGIYVGEEEKCKKLNVVDIMKDQEDEGFSAKIEYGKPPRQNERKKSHSDFCSFYDISLPNEVNETTTNITNSKSVQGACPKPHDKQKDLKTKVINLTQKEQKNEDNRIVVDQNWVEEEQHDPGEIQDDPEEPAGLEQNEYRNLREPESIRKAFIVNWLCILLIISLFSLSIIIYRRSGKNVLPIVFLRTIISLYKTFTPIVSSVYCFDVIRSLFRQILRNAIDSLRNLLGMTRPPTRPNRLHLLLM